MRARAFAAVLLTALAGCLAVSSPACLWTTASDVGNLTTTTCTFQGMATTCGKCVTTSCQKSLDDVCVAASQSSSPEGMVLGYLDACAGGTGGADSSQCDSLTYNLGAGPPTNNSETFVACLNESCATACGITPPTCYENDVSNACVTCLVDSCGSPLTACCVNQQCTNTINFAGCLEDGTTSSCSCSNCNATPTEDALVKCMTASCSVPCAPTMGTGGGGTGGSGTGGGCGCMQSGGPCTQDTDCCQDGCDTSQGTCF